MAGIDQDPVNAPLARIVEPHAIASWPARSAQPLDGWLVRISNGFSGRANSVATTAFVGNPGVAIERAEALYREAGRVPQFQVTPATVPENFAALLKVRGYVPDPDSLVMVAETNRVAAATVRSQENSRVDFLAPGADTFSALTIAGSRSVEDGMERLRILESISHSKACIVLSVDGISVSSGACVATGEWAGVYVMRTEAAFRRRGHAARVLQEAAIWAGKTGAKSLYLQVEGENHAARALYARAGFRDGYRYTYWKLRGS